MALYVPRLPNVPEPLFFLLWPHRGPFLTVAMGCHETPPFHWWSVWLYSCWWLLCQNVYRWVRLCQVDVMDTLTLIWMLVLWSYSESPKIYGLAGVYLFGDIVGWGFVRSTSLTPISFISFISSNWWLKSKRIWPIGGFTICCHRWVVLGQVNPMTPPTSFFDLILMTYFNSPKCRCTAIWLIEEC